MSNGVRFSPSQPVKECIRQLVEQQQLSDEQLSGLMEMQQSLLGTESSATESIASSAIGIRAMLPVALAMLMAVGIWSSLDFASFDHSKQIAREVVDNHKKLKPLQISASSIQSLHQHFSELNFSLAEPDTDWTVFQNAGSSLLGGRYCSISGKTAAQLRYTQDDRLASLYQVHYEPDVYGRMPVLENNQSPKVMIIDHHRVEMWVEQGILMVLVLPESFAR